MHERVIAHNNNNNNAKALKPLRCLSHQEQRCYSSVSMHDRICIRSVLCRCRPVHESLEARIDVACVIAFSWVFKGLLFKSVIWVCSFVVQQKFNKIRFSDAWRSLNLLWICELSLTQTVTLTSDVNTTSVLTSLVLLVRWCNSHMHLNTFTCNALFTLSLALAWVFTSDIYGKLVSNIRLNSFWRDNCDFFFQEKVRIVWLKSCF